MQHPPQPAPLAPRWRGKLLARCCCALLGVLGLAPLVLVAALQSAWVQGRIAAELSQALRLRLGLEARFETTASLWPLSATMTHLVVASNDGGPPALTAERAVLRPRLLALLSGQLDLGDVELSGVRGRAVVLQGELVNVDLRRPTPSGPSSRPTRAPFRRLSVQGGGFELELDGLVAHLGELRAEATGDAGPSVSFALQLAESSTWRVRPAVGYVADERVPYQAVDEDALCHLELRGRWDPSGLTLERLELSGLADGSVASGTAPRCAGSAPADPRRLSVLAEGVEVRLRDQAPPMVSGRVAARVPLDLAARVGFEPVVGGWASLDATLRWDGTTRLPALEGELRGDELTLGSRHLGRQVRGRVLIADDVIELPELEVGIADASTRLTDVTIEPFAPGIALRARRVDGRGATFPGLMRDLGVTPSTIVQWNLDTVAVEDFGGTIEPLQLDGRMRVETSDFMVLDRAWHSPARRRMVGVARATVTGKLGVRPNAFIIYDTQARFGNSQLFAELVSIGFDTRLHIIAGRSSTLDLADISPLVTLELAGRAKLGAELEGPGADPLLLGELSVQGLVLGGFPLGDITKSQAKFRPLALELTAIEGKKGDSLFHLPWLRLAFDEGSTVLLDATVQSERMGLRDLLTMLRFDEDPRFSEIEGQSQLSAVVHFDLGGHLDRCGGGLLEVQGRSRLHWLQVFGERFDGGEGSFRFRWDDKAAGHLGMTLALPSFSLGKGGATLLGSGSIAHGGVVQGQVVGTAVALRELQALGPWAQHLDGSASAVAELHGTLDALALDASAQVPSVRVGNRALGSSSVSVRLTPTTEDAQSLGQTRCGNAIPPPFDPARYAQDRPLGQFEAKGSMFGGMLSFDSLRLTRQRRKVLSGALGLHQLQLGAVADSLGGALRDTSTTTGSLSALVQIERLPLDDWRSGSVFVRLTELALARGTSRVELLPGTPALGLTQGRLSAPRLDLRVTTGAGAGAQLRLGGTLTELGRAPRVDATLEVLPTELEQLLSGVAGIEGASGTLGGRLSVTGPLDRLSYSGRLALERGEVTLRGLGTLSQLELALALARDEVRIERGRARLGGGSLELGGGVALRGFELGGARVTLTARQLGFPTVSQLSGTLDADLVATWQPSAVALESGLEERPLPHVAGTITLSRFDYRRPVVMAASLASLTQRGRRSEVSGYDSTRDAFGFDVLIQARQPLNIENNLVEAKIDVGDAGLLLAGTNQRFGLRGGLVVRPGGRLRLRRSEFEITSGSIEFDDLTRIEPRVDITAYTEYRRYSDAAGSAASSTGAAVSTSTTSATGGRWLVKLRAHGDPDNLRVDLTSEPALAQDDIFLLLTVGVTRAELDQAQGSGVGSSVALEALGTLTGADRAVTDAIPIIDEFRFGSAYSSRTGRTEPTITMGKRLGERTRATVTTGVGDARELRSNLEIRLSPRLSLEGSYDNVNDLSSTVGNLGANLRWRLEFE